MHATVNIVRTVYTVSARVVYTEIELTCALFYAVYTISALTRALCRYIVHLLVLNGVHCKFMRKFPCSVHYKFTIRSTVLVMYIVSAHAGACGAEVEYCTCALRVQLCKTAFRRALCTWIALCYETQVHSALPLLYNMQAHSK